MLYGLIFALAWSLFGSGAHAEERFAFHTSASPHVRVDTVNGTIVVTAGAAGSGIAVVVTKRADTSSEVEALGVARVQRGNDVRLRAVYPSACGQSCRGEISFALVVPPATVLNLGTVNGKVDASGIAGDARLESVNGAVSATYAGVGTVKNVWLGATNGRVALGLPSRTKIGRLRMETSVGKIASGWPVRIDTSNFVGAAVDQTLVAGGIGVTLVTTNGGIALEKR